MVVTICLALAIIINALCIINLYNKISMLEYDDLEGLHDIVRSHWAAEQREHNMIWEVLEELRNGEENGNGTPEM